MDAVQHMPDDIQDIVDLMTEKEIRLHAPLEEIELLLQEWCFTEVVHATKLPILKCSQR